MSKYRNHPIVREIIDRLTDLNLPNIAWSKDVLVSSLDGECQANSDPSNVCITLHFNFDLEGLEYGEHMQIVTFESCIKGRGTGLVSVVMDCIPEDMKNYGGTSLTHTALVYAPPPHRQKRGGLSSN